LVLAVGSPIIIRSIIQNCGAVNGNCGRTYRGGNWIIPIAAHCDEQVTIGRRGAAIIRVESILINVGQISLIIPGNGRVV
jgi:hypothetical protein